MASIEADILLAQSAQPTDAGVSALGLGWQVRPSDPIPWAIVVILRASRDLVGTKHSVIIGLERADGSPVTDSAGNQLVIGWEFTPEGLPADTGLITPIVGAYCFNLPPVPLEEGEEFFFRLRVDGETREHWIAPFRTTPP